MKKILLIFMLLVFNIFSWEVVEQVDSFGDKTGDKILGKVSENMNGGLAIFKIQENSYGFYLACDYYFIGDKFTLSYRAYDKENNILEKYENQDTRGLNIYNEGTFFFVENNRKSNLLVDCLRDKEVHYINMVVASNKFGDDLVLTFYTEGFDISLLD